MMSGILRHNPSTENEIIQDATKKFADRLDKVFSLYRILLNEYVKLLKPCDDIDKESILKSLGIQEYEDREDSTALDEHLNSLKTWSSPVNCTPEKKQTVLKPKEKNSLNISPNLSFDLDKTFESDTHSVIEKAREEILLRSPVLIRARSKSKKHDISSSSTTSKSTPDDNLPLTPKPVFDKELQEYHTQVSGAIRKRKSVLKEIDVENDNNDIIEGTPVAKDTKKLTLSRLYNVDTTVLHNGKKLRQAQLAFVPAEQKTDITKPKTSCMKLYETHSPTTFKAESGKDYSNYDQDDTFEEDIIESSPKSTYRRLQTKSRLKSKKTSPRKAVVKNNANRNNRTSNSVNTNESDNTVLCKLLPENNFLKFSQFSLLSFTSTQQNEPHITKKSSTLERSLCDQTENEFDLDPIKSPVLADINHEYLENCEKMQYEKTNEFKHDIIESGKKAQKRKYSKSIAGLSSDNDETFFVDMERAKTKTVYNLNDSDFAEEMTANKTEVATSPARKCFNDSFDIIPTGQVGRLATTKSDKRNRQSERAKMNGHACWECEQYYKSLGLSEKEIKARKNQCSRHRTKTAERHCSPEGFWNPLFPDTEPSYRED